MGIETVWQFKEVELLVDADRPCTITVSTELPEQDLRLRHLATFDTETTTAGRRPIRVRLPGYIKGVLLGLLIRADGVVRIYQVRVLAKPLGGPGPWQWLTVPVRETPEGYSVAPLPIRETPEGYSVAPLPIRRTPEGYTEVPLPILPTAPVAQWVSLPVDDAA